MEKKTGVKEFNKEAEGARQEVWCSEHEHLVLVNGCSCFAGPHVGEKVSHSCPVLLSTSKHLVKSNIVEYGK